MLDIIVGLVIGFVFFVATVAAYAVGVKHGRVIAEGRIPEMNPVKAVVEQVQEMKTEFVESREMTREEKKMNEIVNTLNKLSQYDPYTAQKGV